MLGAMREYNYQVFDLAREEPVFDNFPSHLGVGDPAPLFHLEELGTGQIVSASGLWSQGPAILEFGSFS
jgi:hypothetical protein